jgi:hypothetical protein
MPTSSATAPAALSASSGSPSRGTGNKTASSPNELLRAVVARLLGRKPLCYNVRLSQGASVWGLRPGDEAGVGYGFGLGV